MMAPLSALCERSDFKLVHLNSRSHNGEIVQLQSALNDDYNNFQEKSNTYHISEPIIGRCLPDLGPFHFISTPPPMEEVNQNLPPKNQLPKFSFPLRKKAIFFQTPRKYLKDQRRRRRDPLRNDVQAPPQKISSIGGCGY